MAFPNDFRWRQMRTLGQGGQATVYEVEDATGALKGSYALKPLKEDATPQALERFRREVSAIKGLDHPGIVKIIENSNPEDQFHYYVMEYIKDAQPLKKLLGKPKNPFFNDAQKSLDLFRQLVAVIAATKKANIVHRDLSPANVLILPNGSIKVIDFGICQIEGETRITLVDEGVGTINYIAPECESGAGGIASFLTDLYSAGKILWSAVTNQVAFARESRAFTDRSMYKLSLNVMTWHLHHIFEKTIRHNPRHRFASPDEALHIIKIVADTIKMRGQPLELLLLDARCRICFFGEIASPPDWPGVASHPFRNPLPDGLVPVTCNHCGSWEVIDREHLTKELRRRASLQ